jgi:FkbM family methyltransferase
MFESKMPSFLSAEEINRIKMTVSCGDCDQIPKVQHAGEVFDSPQGHYQLMHNGVKVVEDGYCGHWMTELIRQLKGHHEPQEEKVFHEIVARLRPGATMIELGSWWSYYSLWLKKAVPDAKNYLIEPDPYNLEVGRKNFELNDADGHFFQAVVGRASLPSVPFRCESDNRERMLEMVCLDDFVEREGIDTVDLLLCDIQGFELQMLLGAKRCIEQGRLRFLVLSTHHHSISRDPLMHEKCLQFLKDNGAYIIAAHTIDESYSGDGLIAASFKPDDHSIPPIVISKNDPANSLFAKAGPMGFISYAQNNEDVMLWRALKDVYDGFYVDVGANDPVVDSVTNAFYERGWLGINIEPMNSYYRKLCNSRPLDVSLNLAAGNENGETVFYEIPETGLSTLDKNTAILQKEAGWNVVEIPCQVRTLNDILNEHAAGRTIHYLKIDVEGGEKAVLEGLDLVHWRPWIIVVEATIPLSQQEANLIWESIINTADYQHVYSDGINRFYVAREKAELTKAFSVPPNFFDFYISDELHDTRIKAADRDSLRAALDATVADKDILRVALDATVADRDNLFAALDSVRKEKEMLQFEKERIQKHLDEVWAHRELVLSELDVIHHSRSWKITYPMRVLFARGRAWKERLIHPEKRTDSTPVLGLKGKAKRLLRRMVDSLRRTSWVVDLAAKVKNRFPRLWFFVFEHVKSAISIDPEIVSEIPINHSVTEDEQYFLDLFQREITRRRGIDKR